MSESIAATFGQNNPHLHPHYPGEAGEVDSKIESRRDPVVTKLNTSHVRLQRGGSQDLKIVFYFFRFSVDRSVDR